MTTETLPDVRETIARIQALGESARKQDEKLAALEAKANATNSMIEGVQRALRQGSISLPGTEDLVAKKEYSYNRLLDSIYKRDPSLAPVEHEVSQQCIKRLSGDALTRVMSTLNPSAGGFLVPEQISSTIIPKLDANLIMKSLGVTVIKPTGAPYRQLKQTGGGTASMVGELGSSSASDLSWSRVNLMPKKAQARSFVTNEQILFSDVEQQVIADLLLRHELKKDQQIIAGSGSENEVMGIINTSAVNTINSGSTSSLLWGDLNRAEAEIATDNVLYTALGVAARPKIFATLARQLVRAVSTTQTEAEGAGFVGGYPFLSKAMFKTVTGHMMETTTQIPTTSGGGGNEAFVIVGKFSDFMLAEFGGIVIARSEDATDGTLNAFLQDGVHIKVTSWFDGAVLQPESFCTIQDIVES